jgi:hypothetical protein
MTVASSPAQRRTRWHPRPVVDDGEASRHGLTRPARVPARHRSGLRVRVEHLQIQPQQLTNVLVAGWVPASAWPVLISAIRAGPAVVRRAGWLSV